MKTFSVKNWQTGALIICFLQSAVLWGQAAVEVERMNVVIGGLENPLRIVVSDVPDSCLCLRTGSGTVVRYGAGRYGWRVGSDTTAAQLTILDSCHNEVVAQRIFRVKPVPVEVRLGYHPSKAMTAGEFKAQGGLIAWVTDCDIEARFNIVGFTAQFFSKKTGEMWSGYNTGGRFEGAVLEKIQGVAPGDWVIFHTISYRYPGADRARFSEGELVFRIE